MMVMAAASPVSAQGVYINDVVQVALRAEPGYDHGVVTLLRSGDRVERLDDSGDWSRVRSADGSEGWVLSRLLTDKTPNVLKLKRLEQELDAIRQRGGEAGGELAAALEEKLRLQNALAEVRFELEAAQQAYTELKKKSAGGGEANQALADARKQIDQQTRQLEDCRRQAAEMGQRETLYWFLAGAGVLMAGLLAGFRIGRRPRSKLY